MQTWKAVLVFFGAVAAVLGTLAIVEKPKSIYRDKPQEQNPLEGKRVRFVMDNDDPVNADGERGHLKEITDPSPSSLHCPGFYERFIKRGLDLILSFIALIIVSPIMLLLCIAVFIDDPGPVFFTQKRFGKNKRYFALHKFRTMKMATPHDVPTHMLEDPEAYITRVGKILRKMSLDELPQLWDIFIGNMSLVGPRPGLWNQDVLLAKREEFGANDVTPGLTGWAQINGRDELEIGEKARLDGDYCRDITFKMDVTCIIATAANVLKHTGVVEGGTGKISTHIDKRKKEVENRKHSILK